MYYAVNTFWDDESNRREERLSLEDEKTINQTANSRIVGFTIETRPDTITAQEIRRLRNFGVTRVQLGIQHIDDDVLDTVNRRCSTRTTIKALEVLKRNCFKIDSHWMLNLPGASPDKDKRMLNDVLLGANAPVKQWVVYHKRSWSQFLKGQPLAIKELWEQWDIKAPELATDTWKIYPTAVTPWTDIEKWYREGTYKPYDERTMFEILMDSMRHMYPWIRVARIIRDIPQDYMFNENTGADNTNMRQELDDELKVRNIYCMDIRNREVKNKDWDGNYVVVIRQYKGSNGDEYFISAESMDKRTLYGFVRLRLDDGCDKIVSELNGAALVREVHCLGMSTHVGSHAKHVQHRGIGRKLMARAEALAKEKGYDKIAVIAAQGNIKYYEKLGYGDTGYYMIKSLLN
jgi:histone acetyltransferase (RNA polymerase elongator complex component)